MQKTLQKMLVFLRWRREKEGAEKEEADGGWGTEGQDASQDSQAAPGARLAGTNYR